MPCVVRIHWGTINGTSFDSPPIGPFERYADAARFATEMRKRLRRVGRPWRNRVTIEYIASPGKALSWGLHGGEVYDR